MASGRAATSTCMAGTAAVVITSTLLYALEASEDYDPTPERISTKVLSVNFALAQLRNDEFDVAWLPG